MTHSSSTQHDTTGDAQLQEQTTAPIQTPYAPVPDGGVVQLRLLDLETGRLVWESEPLSGLVGDWQVSPTGRWLLFVRTEFDEQGRIVNTLHRLDMTEGRTLSRAMRLNVDGNKARIVFHPSAPRAVIVEGPDLNRVTDPPVVRLWDVETMQPTPVVFPHNAAPSHVQFTHDGRRLFTAIGRSGRVWDAVTGDPVTDWLEHPADIEAAAFSADGLQVRTVAGGLLHAWDAARGEVVSGPFLATGMRTLAFGPDNRRSITGGLTHGFDRPATPIPPRIWSVETGKPLTALLRQPGEIRDLEFAPDARRVLTLGSRPSESGMQLRVWETTPRGVERPLGRWTRSTAPGWVSPDGSRIVVQNDDDSISLADTASGKRLFQLQKPNLSVLERAYYSADGSHVLSVSNLPEADELKQTKTFQLAELGRYDEAAALQGQCVLEAPERLSDWFELGMMRLLAGDEIEYRRICSLVWAKFRSAGYPSREQLNILHLCLLRPNALPDYTDLVALARRTRAQVGAASPWGAVMLGSALVRAGQYDEAEPLLRHAFDVLGNQGIDAGLMLALAQQRLGRTEDARKTLDAAYTRLTPFIERFSARGQRARSMPWIYRDRHLLLYREAMAGADAPNK